jgi:hypothetical protein
MSKQKEEKKSMDKAISSKMEGKKPLEKTVIKAAKKTNKNSAN